MIRIKMRKGMTKIERLQAIVFWNWLAASQAEARYLERREVNEMLKRFRRP